MWWLLFRAVLQGLAMIVIGELLRPKPKVETPKPSGLGDFNFPTAQEGRPIPVGWGTFKVSGPNVTWYGDLETKPIKQKQKTGLFSSTKVTIGYKYLMGVEHSLCFGYIDEFIGLQFDDRDVTLTGFTTTADEFRFTMDSPTLFGKEKEQGGVSGQVRFYRGTFTQSANEYMRQKLGKAAIPAYRPVARAVFEHCYLGNSGNVQPPSFIVRRTPNPLGLTANRHNLGGDANPANMLFEILTDRTWGLGRSSALIDTASFIQCGNTLAAEGLGLSMLVDNVQNGWALMAEILRHVDGVVYQDFASGKFTMALVRDDYDAGAALELNESNIVPGSLKFARASWEDTQNTVMVKYLDRSQKFTERTVQQQNLANINARGGAVEAEEYDFLGFSNSAAANYVCGRVLRTASSPLAKIELEANREATKLRPGSVFRLNWPSLGVTALVGRVTEIDYGTLDNPLVRITAIEDIFSVDDVAFDAPGPSEWVSPVGQPQPITVQRLLEAPRAFYGDARMVAALAARPGGQEVGFLVETDPAGGTTYTEIGESSDFTPNATLVADYGRTTHGLDTVGFVVNGASLLEDLDSVSAAERAAGESLLLIDDEVMAYTGLTNNGDGTWTITGIQQGVLDTTPARHLAGARVWFLQGGVTSALDLPLDADGAVRTRLRTVTTRDVLPAASAPAMTTTTVSRASRPYPPAGVTVNTLYYDGAIITDGAAALTLAWNHRDRLLQVDGSVVLQQDAASVGPEAGVTYTVKLYDEDGVLRRTQTGVTTAGYTWATEADDCGLTDGLGAPRLSRGGRVVVEAWRAGLKAYQDHDFTWYRPEAMPVEPGVPATELAITGAFPTEVVVGEESSSPLAAIGVTGAPVWQLVDPPAGASISVTGVLRFTPAATGFIGLTVRLIDSATSLEVVRTFYTSAAAEATPAPAPSGSLPDGYAFVPYASNGFAGDGVIFPPVAGGAWWVGRTTLPSGITAGDQQTPLIVGYPTETGVFDWSVPAELYPTGAVTTLSGNVNILPEPVCTFWNPEDRQGAGAAVGFRTGPAPYLTVEGVLPYSPDGNIVTSIRAYNGFTAGKLYWEVKIEHVPEGDYCYSLGVDGSDFGVGSSVRVLSQTIDKLSLDEYLWGITVIKRGTRKDTIINGRGSIGFYEAISVDEGDILRFALDASTGDLWIGKGTRWIRGGDPITGDTPTWSGLSADPAGFWGDLRPLASLSHGARVTANFGDQPWEGGGPPSGFLGVPYSRFTGYARQVWDTDTQSLDASFFNRPGLLLSAGNPSGLSVHRDSGCIAFFNGLVSQDTPHSVLGSFPRASGRLQFEIELQHGYTTRSYAGLAPADWDNTTALVRPGWEPGTFGFRFGSGGTTVGSGPGEIYLDGVEQPETMPLCSAGDIITFYCNFAGGEVSLYRNGTLIGVFVLPSTPAAGWVPVVAGGALACMRLITTSLTYPIAGATNWNPAEVVPRFRNRITTQGDRRVTTAGDVRITKE